MPYTVFSIQLIAYTQCWTAGVFRTQMKKHWTQTNAGNHVGHKTTNCLMYFFYDYEQEIA